MARRTFLTLHMAHLEEKRIIEIVSDPQAPEGTYLWVGTERGENFFGYTVAKTRTLSKFAHALLKAIGEE